MSEESWVFPHIGSVAGTDLAIDVGSNEGVWTLAFSKVFASVIAVEPDLRVVNRCASLQNVRVVNAAACESDGRAVLFLRPSPDQNSLLQEHPIGGGKQADAPAIGSITTIAITLDTLAPRGADIVKIDVEGAEEKVLAGCSLDGRWDRTVFVVECHDTFDAIKRSLERLGKRVVRINHPMPSAHRGHCWAIGRRGV